MRWLSSIPITRSAPASWLWASFASMIAAASSGRFTMARERMETRSLDLTMARFHAERQ